MIKVNRIITKVCWIISLTLLIFVLIFVIIQKKTKEIDFGRIGLIDVVGNNYIFRGNNPFVIKNGNKVFAYEELTAYLHNMLSGLGYKNLPHDYYLVSINLLDLDEYSDIKKENDFFRDNPTYGMSLNVSTLSPSLLLLEFPSTLASNVAAKDAVEDYNIWVTKTIKKIHDIASSKTDKPIFVYIHCDSGRDRTGLISASYRLMFKDMNLSSAVLLNVSEAGRNSESFYNLAITSYCLHVKKDHDPDYCL